MFYSAKMVSSLNFLLETKNINIYISLNIFYVYILFHNKKNSAILIQLI